MDEDDEPCVLDHQPSPSTVRAVRFYVMFLLLWQSLCRVSNSGMNIFLAMFLSLVLAAVPSDEIQNFVNLLSRTVLAARGSLVKEVTCFANHSLYSMDLCKVTLPDKSITSRKCSYVKFPHHPHRIQRSPCDVMLMKTVRTSSGTTSLYPQQIFCYQSIIQSLRNFFLRPGFTEQTELWRRHTSSPGTLSDVYDGIVWSEFLNLRGHPFLSLPALSLNIDWFQPFKRSTYSVGAIYMAIQNLPRSERHASDIILVGIIPGPKEPKYSTNTYLRPPVNELNELWTGVPMQLASGIHTIVRAALICVSCDISESVWVHWSSGISCMLQMFERFWNKIVWGEGWLHWHRP